MNIPDLKAIKDWCLGKFQPKGDYLSSVPEEYVTGTELNSAVANLAPAEHLHGSVKTITFATTEPSEVAEDEIVFVYEA